MLTTTLRDTFISSTDSKISSSTRACRSAHPFLFLHLQRSFLATAIQGSADGGRDLDPDAPGRGRLRSHRATRSHLRRRPCRIHRQDARHGSYAAFRRPRPRQGFVFMSSFHQRFQILGKQSQNHACLAFGIVLLVRSQSAGCGFCREDRGLQGAEGWDLLRERDPADGVGQSSAPPAEELLGTRSTGQETRQRGCEEEIGTTTTLSCFMLSPAV